MALGRVPAANSSPARNSMLEITTGRGVLVGGEGRADGVNVATPGRKVGVDVATPGRNVGVRVAVTNWIGVRVATGTRGVRVGGVVRVGFAVRVGIGVRVGF